MHDTEGKRRRHQPRAFKAVSEVKLLSISRIATNCMGMLRNVASRPVKQFPDLTEADSS